MGGKQSTQTGSSGYSAGGMDTFQLAMSSLAKRTGGVYGGGCDSFFGGDTEIDPAKGLREYEMSLSHRAKEDVIRRLADALSNAGVQIDSKGDLEDIVKEMAAKIPNPRKGTTFKSDAVTHEKVCRTIAKVLNDQFTPQATKAADKLIDVSLGPVAVCQQVAEWVHSFASGVNTEFLAVHASVRNALQAIQVLDQIMAELYNKITGKVDISGDS